MSLGTFRSFVAVSIPPAVKDFLASYVKAASPVFPEWRFGAAPNVHVTLQFLGDVDRDRIPSLTGALSTAVRDMPAFAAGLGHAGTFPERGAPRILHIVVDQCQDLVRLAGKVGTALAGAGFRPDKPFAAHITLGRPKSGRGGGAGDVAARWRDFFARFQSSAAPTLWEVSEVLLMESILGPSGSTYIVQGRAPLLRSQSAP